MLEHPDITSAQETGWPCGAAGENQDCAEYRREFAEERIKDFIDFALAGDSEIVDNFVRHYRPDYKIWLN